MAHPGMMYPGMVHPGMMYPGYPAAPVPPATPAPTKKPKNPNAPGWAQNDETDEDGNPGGAIKGGKSNVNVPVLAGESLPGALLPLWSVVLICIGIIIVLVCCCWCSIKVNIIYLYSDLLHFLFLKVHGAMLNRNHRNAAKRQQKESEMTIARLNTEIDAMKAIAKQQAEREAETSKQQEAQLAQRAQTNLTMYPDHPAPSYEEASLHPDAASVAREQFQHRYLAVIFFLQICRYRITRAVLQY